jgi:hypothetical protein
VRATPQSCSGKYSQNWIFLVLVYQFQILGQI